MAWPIRFVVLLCCVPLLLAPDVCTCSDSDGRPRHEQHEPDHHHTCLGSLGLDYDDCVQHAANFDLPCWPAVLVEVLNLDDVEQLSIPAVSQLPPKAAVPRYLSHLTLII